VKMIPPVERIGVIQSSAERRVAHLLAQVELSEAATCLYSVHLPRHEYKRMSEIDFLVVTGGAVLILEVKGGRLSRRDGLWTFTDRFGEVHEKREGPFEQARSAMFAFERLLNERILRPSVSFGTLVITPDQELNRDLEWAPEEYLGPTGMSVASMRAAISRALRGAREANRGASAPTSMGEIVRAVRPDFDRVPRLSLLSGSLEQDYLRLASEQYDALRGSEINDRIFVTGGAGSGKTLLAIETARRAASVYGRVLLTCRSSGVIDLMKEQLAAAPVTCLSYAETSGLDPFDVLIVDEGQDLMTLEDLVHLDSLVIGGLADGRWRIFCDPNNQAHVDGAFDATVADEVAAMASRYHLPYNCRNTAGIVQQTQVVTGADLGVAKAGEGPKVEYRRCNTDMDSAALLDAELKRLRHDEVPHSDVVVLTLRADGEASSAGLTKAFRRGALVPLGKDGAGEYVRLATAREFKGLEAAHVVVVDVDDLTSAEQLSRLYVAMTRPRISLSLIVRDRAWEQMRNQTAGKGEETFNAKR
jgi:hypothetical protein